MTALLVAAVLAGSPVGPAFIEDDFTQALAKAKASKKLLLVDAWAPWCHTCVFMREHVLNQAAFKPFEKDVVFASIDTEKASSAAFLETYPVNIWPTLFFIDPATGSTVFKWIGSADAAQMKGLLDAARKKDGAVKDADALFAQGKADEAAQQYAAAVKKAKGSAAARAPLSMLNALASSKQHEACAKGAAELAPTLKATSDRINALTWGLGCALELDEKADGREALVKSLVEQTTAATTLKGAMADDVSGLYELLVSERHAVKDEAGAQALAKTWLTYLEAEAAKATTPEARAVFDPHRLSAALASKQVERVIAPLEASERDLPKDFNPPARLALARAELGQTDAALADIGRALQKNQGGPRKLRLLEIQASLFATKKDVVSQKRVLTEALEYGKALPASQRPASKLTQLESKLAALNTPEAKR